MKELLQQYGFILIGKCNCIGPQTYKYKNGFYRLYWHSKHKKFKIKYKGRTITQLHNETEFENVWKKEIENLSAA